MLCLIKSEWFNRLLSGNSYHDFMIGFGNHEEGGNVSINIEPDKDLAYKKRLQSDLLLAIDRDLNGMINFSEYMMIRHAVSSWIYCAEKGMNRQSLRCALSLVSDRTPTQAEADQIYELGQTFSQQN